MPVKAEAQAKAEVTDVGSKKRKKQEKNAARKKTKQEKTSVEVKNDAAAVEKVKQNADALPVAIQSTAPTKAKRKKKKKNGKSASEKKQDSMSIDKKIEEEAKVTVDASKQEEAKLAKTTKKREARAARKKERRQQKKLDWENLSEEQKEAALERAKEARAVRAEKSQLLKEKRKQALEAALNLVIDLESCENMQPQEIRKTAYQISLSYITNIEATAPIRLTLTSLKGGIKDRLEKLPGFEKWSIHKEEKSFKDVFDKKKKRFVYLSDSEAAPVLDHADESKIYVYSGLTKSLSMEKAKEEKISIARLPVQQNTKSTSKVLPVHQIVQAILKFQEAKDATTSS